jgi:hypothetical protein
VAAGKEVTPVISKGRKRHISCGFKLVDNYELHTMFMGILK